ncbi:MAG: response regulator [Gemmataceae bacterium]|nr:response regulator [Gemmataceae bacterium]
MGQSIEGEPLALTEAILRGLHQVTDWGILTTDARMTITGWSRWLEINSGLRAEQVIGRNLLELFPELVTGRLEQCYRQALTGQTIVLSQRLHGHLIALPSSSGDAPTMHQSVRIVPITSEEGVAGTITLIEDVTERVGAETELRTRARQQTAVADLSQMALGGAEFSVLANEAVKLAVKALGADYGELRELLARGRLALQAQAGMSGFVTVTDIAVDPGSQAEYVLRASEPVVILDFISEARFEPQTNLKTVGIRSGVVAKVSDSGNSLGVFGVYSVEGREFTSDDVQFLQAFANVLGMAAERKRLERELRSRAESLAVADKRKDEFLAMLAHELRNPLAPIRNAMAVLHFAGATEPEHRWAREVIVRQVAQLTRLVDDLLDVSRITRGKINFHKERVELASVIARAVETSRPLIDARKHELRLALPADPLWLEADSTRLGQVLGNLLNNAAKYTPESGTIWLSCCREAGEIVIRVRDTGVGIPADMLPYVFDLFMQADRSLDRSEGGLGIGLTLVRSLVSLHGGSVEALSAGPGHGSEFVVRLPALPVEQPETSRLMPNGAPLSWKSNRRVLVVDDNEDSAETLAMVLKLSGHDVRMAHDGNSAIRLAQAFQPEVVLLDIGLPGMSGIEVARQLRQDPGLKHALIAAITGYGQDSDRQRSEEAGFDAHLVKPIDLDELRSLLSTLTKSPAVH